MGLKQTPKTPLLVAGRVERVALPAWGIESLRAKVDTGARSSALHVDALRQVSESEVEFEVVLSLHRRRRVRVRSPFLRIARVRPTSGVSESRYVVPVEIVLGPLRKSIEVTLAERGAMRFRMLLGRRALAGDFLVDPARPYLLSRASMRPPVQP